MRPLNRLTSVLIAFKSSILNKLAGMSIAKVLSFVSSFLIAMFMVSFNSATTFAGGSTNKGISLQMIVKDPSGNLVTSSIPSVNAKIIAPNGCILREETFSNINIVNGYLSIAITKGTVGGADPGLVVQKVFDNSTSNILSGLTCINLDGSTNTSVTSYTPLSTDVRKIRISFLNGSDSVVGDFNLRSVPFATNSDTLNGKADSDFVSINSSQGVTQSNIESIFNRFTKLDTILGRFSADGTSLSTNITGNAATADNVTGTVAVANGGTGATTAAAARANLGLGSLATISPTGSADATTYLRGDGTWAVMSGGGGGAVSSVAGKTGTVTLVAADLTDFNTAADARITAQKGNASGLASLDISGKIPSSQLALGAGDIPSLSAAKINSGTLAVAQGGTGQSSYTDGQILIGNTATGNLSKSTLTAGTGVTITNGNGTITISSSGSGGTVTNVTGTSPISVATGTSTPVISFADGTATGQVHRWDGTSAWVSTKLNYTDLVNASAVSPWPSSTCTSGQAITWSSVSDGFSCSTLSIATSQLTGTLAAAQMPAFTGDVTSSSGATALTLSNSGVTSGTYNSVTVDAKGRVTAGTNPTTLSGYGITDAVKNLGGVGNMSAGLDANKPGTPASGDLFVTTDSQKIYRYNGVSWDIVSSAGGTGGTVTSITAGTGLTGGAITGSGTIGLGTELTGVNSLSTTGFLKRTGAGAYSTSSSISLSSDISGTLPVANGGTGQTTYTDGQLLIGNSTGNTLTKSTLTAGTGISITNGSGAITIANTGLTGTSSFSGDVSGTASTTSVDKIKGTAVSATAPTSGQFLVYNGTTQYAPVSLSGDATISTAGALTLKNTGTAGTYTKVTTDAQGRVTSGTTLSASDIPSLDWTKITTGKPTTLSGYGVTDAIQNAGNTPSVQTGTFASRPAFGTAGTYTKVTTDAQGRVSSGTTLTASDIPNLDWAKITTGKPTTLSGYGVTDGIQNAGNTPSVQTGTFASRPAFGTAGRLYISSDTNIIYRDTGA
ncbi:MAG: beta strand repeat-containing protein, partial [Pseudobdellovibrionaceae bacterium]